MNFGADEDFTAAEDVATALTLSIHPEGEQVPSFVAAESAEESYVNAAAWSWFEGHLP